jgi:molecular chaperone DnaK (HSP70)
VTLRLGIDFGTTRTVVAFCDRGNYPVVSFADQMGDPIECYPSIVAERDGELRFGYEAAHQLADPSWTVLRSFKRLLSGDVTPETIVTIGGTSLRIDELLTKFFAALRDALTKSSNIAAAVRRNKRIDAMIAAPANSHSAQRFLSLDGFRQAGFEILGLLNEPSAAGFEYTHRFRNTLTTKRDHVVVYDIGGGTFDVSLLQMSGARHEVVTSAGISRLGGDDFDEILVDLALERAQIPRASLGRRQQYMLTEACRELKERLNPSSRKVSVDLDACLGKGSPVAEIVIDVGEFYDRCEPLVQRTIDVTLPLMERADRDGDTADMVASDIAGIYVVGGASSLPVVGRALRQHFGKRVHRSPYPSGAAAIGLAIAADEDTHFELTDRFSRVFGVFREGRSGMEVTFDPIIGRDVPLPPGKGTLIVCERTYHAAHNVGHFRYVECSDVDASGVPRGDIDRFADIYFPFDRALRGSDTDLASVPIRRFGEPGPLMRETYAIDSHGIVEVKIANLDESYERTFRFSRAAD